MKFNSKLILMMILLMSSCSNNYNVNENNNSSNLISVNSSIFENNFSNEVPSIDKEEEYNETIKEFTNLFNEAINESEKDMRLIKLAKAEQYLLDSCVIFPYMNDNIKYGVSRIIPSSYLFYNSLPYSFDNLIVTNELLDNNTIKQLKYVEDIKEYLLFNNYTLKDNVSIFHYEEFNSLNIFNKLSFDNKLMLNQCYSSLFKIDNNGKLVNDLIESYEISEDGYTFSFTLKDNIYWYNYNCEIIDEIKAIDFGRGLKMYLSNMAGNSKIKGAEEYLNNLISFDNVKINASDDKTLSITLTKPNVNLFYEISAYLFPLHKNIESLFDSNMPYTYKDLYYCGSYVIGNVKDNKITLIKNINYHNSNNVNLNQINFYYEMIPSNSIIDNVISGTYDELLCSYNDKMYKLINQNMKIKNQYYPIKVNNKIHYGCFNLSHDKVNDINLRKALVYSFNKEQFLAFDYNDDIVKDLICNSMTPYDLFKISDNFEYENVDFSNKTYIEIIQYFANTYDKVVDYSYTYNEGLATYYFSLLEDESITLNIVTISKDRSKIDGYLNDVKRLSNNKVNFEIIEVNNQYDYYVLTNKKEYDIMLFNYWTPDYYSIEAFISPFTEGGEKNKILGL